MTAMNLMPRAREDLARLKADPSPRTLIQVDAKSAILALIEYCDALEARLTALERRQMR